MICFKFFVNDLMTLGKLMSTSCFSWFYGSYFWSFDYFSCILDMFILYWTRGCIHGFLFLWVPCFVPGPWQIRNNNNKKENKICDSSLWQESYCWPWEFVTPTLSVRPDCLTTSWSWSIWLGDSRPLRSLLSSSALNSELLPETRKQIRHIEESESVRGIIRRKGCNSPFRYPVMLS